MKNLKIHYKWLQPLTGLVISILMLTLSFFTLISYSGYDKTIYISGYNFYKDNSTSTTVIDRESAKLLSEDDVENGDYVSLILVSSERSHRTDKTETFSVIATCFIVCFIILMIFNIFLDGVSFINYYRLKFSWLNLALKCLIFTFCVVITISIGIYLANLPQGLQDYYHIGFGAILLPIFALLNIVIWLIFKIRKGKLRNE